MNSQLKSNIVYILSFFSTTAISFLLLPIYTHKIGILGFGQLAMVQIYATFMTSMVNLGLLNIYERSFFDYSKNERNNLLFTILMFMMMFIAVIAILTHTFRDFISLDLLQTHAVKNLLLPAFLGTSLISITQYFIVYNKSSLKPKSVMAIQISQSLINHFTSLFCIIVLGYKAFGVLLGPVVANSAIFLVCFSSFIVRNKLKLSFTSFWHNLKIALPLALYSFTNIINSQFDKYMINLLQTLGGVGIYNLGQRVSNGVFSLMTALGHTYVPMIYSLMFSTEKKKAAIKIGRILTPYAFISALFALLGIIFSLEIITILAPEKFNSAANIILILSLSRAILFFGKQKQLIYAKKTKLLLILNIIGIILNITLNTFFIIKYGAIGAALATLITVIISSIIHFYYAQKYFYIKWEKIKIGFIFSYLFICSIVFYFVNLTPQISLPTFFAKIVVLMLYLLIGHQLSIFRFENRRIKIFVE